MKLDITKLTQAADRLLPDAHQPRHIAMISNYRRHAMLEVSGRYEEILIPGDDRGGTRILESHSRRSVNFKGMKPYTLCTNSSSMRNICVQMLTNERLMVNDWGFSSFSTFQTLYPARYAMSQGALVDDMDAVYIQTCDKAMFWHYDDRNWLQNEIVWGVRRVIASVHPRSVDARGVCDLLAPLIDQASSHVAAA